MEIYTNAPATLDYAGTTQVGDFGFGLLRVVSVCGPGVTATAQLHRYTSRGFFATVHRKNAIAFLALEGRLENPTLSDLRVW